MNNLLRQLCKELNDVVEENKNRIKPEELEEIVRKASESEELRHILEAIRARN